MSTARLKRTMGLLSGALLLCLGMLGMWIIKGSYSDPVVHRFCEAWFCPDEFSPEHVFQLGQKATLGDAAGQLAVFQHALILDSASAYRWADVGDSEFNVQDLPKARYAYGRALAAGPRSAVILLRAANFYFASGDYENVVPQLTKILSDGDLSDYYNTVFLTYSRLGMQLSEILKRGIPARSSAGAPFLKFWMTLGKEPEARETWNWLSKRGQVDDTTTGAYIGFLLSKGQGALARQTWRDQTSDSNPEYAKTNWIFNGDFEKPFKPSPLDWKIEPTPGVDVERVKSPVAAGQWALQFIFHANTNLDYRQTYQSVVVSPGNWRFIASIRTRDITTDQGPHFHIVDYKHPKNLDIWTEPVTGTDDWHETSTKFHVNNTSGVIRIELVRTPSTKFDNKISGIAWIDDVRLVPIGS